MTDYQIAVLDVGKTNKKLFVYDANLRCLNPAERGVVLDPIEWEGVTCDDMAGLWRWMLAGLRAAAAEHPNIRCISISAHGATIALLGGGRDEFFPGDGGLVFPIVSYTQPITPEEEGAFFRDVGLSPEDAQRQTGTARLGWLLNHGKQVHWLQRRFPDRWARVTGVLMFPQYLGYLLTGEQAIEPTYIGCHGYLLDIDGRHYSAVADRLGIAEMLPPLPFRATWEPLGRLHPQVADEVGLARDCLVTLGVHDSNAALVPYFVKSIGAKKGSGTLTSRSPIPFSPGPRTDFVVQDSGTWIVTMAPCEEPRFAEDEIGREVFFNWSIYGRPVKTTIFRGGAEFEFYRDRVLAGRPHPAEMDVDLLRGIIAGREAFALPTIERGSGLFPASVPRLEGLDTVFRDTASAWHVVDLGLAVQGAEAIRLAAGADVASIFIEGNVGRSNPVYRWVITALFPEASVAYGTLGGAPYGAAILGVAAVEGVRPEALADRVEMMLTEVPRPDFDPAQVRSYAAAFLSRLET